MLNESIRKNSQVPLSPLGMAVGSPIAPSRLRPVSSTCKRRISTESGCSIFRKKSTASLPVHFDKIKRLSDKTVQKRILSTLRKQQNLEEKYLINPFLRIRRIK